MSLTLYVKAASKKAINESLARGERVTGMSYSMFGADGPYALGPDVPEGTVIKVYQKIIDGNPYAKAYGQWKGGKVK